MKMQVRLKGAEDIKQRLNLLPKEIAGQELREVALQGAEVIRKQAEANALAHKVTGTLAGDIQAAIARESLGQQVVVHVGPGKEGWYGRLVEFGHAQVRVTGRVRRGRRTYRIKQQLGQVPSHPWLRPAFDATKEQAQNLMADEFRRRLERIWRRR